MARASGVRRDIRKDDPYLCFKDNWDGQGAPAVDFKVPVMTTGDVYARYLVRLEEMKQSLAIIRQLIDHIPPGAVNVSPEGKDVLPPKNQVYSSIEGLIQHFELIMTNRGFEAPKGRSLQLHRKWERGAWLLRRLRRRERPMARPHAAAVLYQLPGFPEAYRRPHDFGCSGGTRKHQHHRRRTG